MTKSKSGKAAKANPAKSKKASAPKPSKKSAVKSATEKFTGAIVTKGGHATKEVVWNGAAKSYLGMVVDPTRQRKEAVAGICWTTATWGASGKCINRNRPELDLVQPTKEAYKEPVSAPEFYEAQAEPAVEVPATVTADMLKQDANAAAMKVVTNSNRVPQILLRPEGLPLNHYNLPPDLYCNVVVFIPAKQTLDAPFGCIYNGETNKAVKIGYSQKSLYSPKGGNGKWWLGSLTEQREDYCFFPRIAIAEFPEYLEKHLFQEAIGLYFYVNSEATYAKIAVDLAKIKGSKHDEYTITYHRPEDPAILQRNALEKANATQQVTKKVQPVKAAKPAKEPKAVEIKAAGVEVDQTLTTALTGLKNLRELDALYKQITEAGKSVFRKSDGLQISQFEEMECTKPDTFAITFNNKKGCMYGYVIPRFWVVGTAKAV